MDAATERKLKHIYDLIDTKNYKSAVKQATALSQKHPKNPHFMLAKAFAFLHLDKPEEALEICNTIKNSDPSDERLLGDLHGVYVRLGKAHEATECYEKALKRDPTNTSLEMALFFSYVKEDNFIKQQQVAMRLYKKLSTEQALMWTVCSIDLQALMNPEQGKRLLPLAEMMLKRRVDSIMLSKYESLLVYISILAQQEKYAEVLNVINGELGNLFTIPTEKLRIQGEMLSKLGRFADAQMAFESILSENADDWAALNGYLDTAFQQSLSTEFEVLNISGKQESALEATKAIPGYNSASTFLKALQLKAGNSLKRGPFLAELELERRLLTGPLLGTRDSSAMAEVIRHYFNGWGHMVSFASDARAYVALIDGSHREKLGLSLLEAAENTVDSDAKLRKLRKQISARKVYEQLGLPLAASNDELVQWASDLAKLYASTLYLSLDSDPKEVGCSDEVLSMAVNCLVEMYRRTADHSFLVEAVLCLEHALAYREYNPSHKLALISIYCILGATELAMDLFMSLDVKNVMLESMSHHVWSSLVKSGQVLTAENLARSLTNFHDESWQEGPEIVAVAYKHDNYTKVREFVEFKHTLRESHQNQSMAVDFLLMDVLRHAGNAEKLKLKLLESEFGKLHLPLCTEPKLTKLKFNEDVSTRQWWAPTELKLLLPFYGEETNPRYQTSWQIFETEEFKAEREFELKKTLRLRAMLPRLISLSLQLDGDAQELSDLLELIKTSSTDSAPHSDSAQAKMYDLAFTAALDWVKSGSLIPESQDMVAEVVDAQKSFRDKLGSVRGLFVETTGRLLKATIVPWEAKEQVGSSAEMEKKNPELAIGIGLPFLTQFFFEAVSILVTLVCHWSSSLKSGAQNLSKKKKKIELPSIVEESRQETGAALSELSLALASSIEDSLALLQKYESQSIADEAKSWLTILKDQNLFRGLVLEQLGKFSPVIKSKHGSEKSVGADFQSSVLLNLLRSQRKIVNFILEVGTSSLKSLKRNQKP